jgi:hypothetical protein
VEERLKLGRGETGKLGRGKKEILGENYERLEKSSERRKKI